MTTKNKLKTHLHSLSMADALAAYPSLDKNLTDYKAIRKLVTVDLFYLLSRICGLGKLANFNRQWIYERCREVEANPNGRLFLWARGHYKSTIITFGKTLQDILTNPEMTFCIFSAKQDNASSFLTQIARELEKNELIRKAYPHVCWDNPKHQADKWNQTEIVVKRKGNPKEMTLTAASLETFRTGGHYDVLLYDDVITDKEVTNPDMIREITQTFRLSLNLSKETSVYRYIGTRYAHKDTYFHIIKDGIATPSLYPATDDGTTTGNPVLFTQELWEATVRKNTSFDLSCQYLLKPQDGSTKVFDINLLRYWDVRPTAVRVYLLCDPGVRTNKEACDTAMAVIGVTSSHHFFLLDGRSHRMTQSERWENYSYLYKKWVSQVGVGQVHCAYETYGSGAADMDYFKEQMTKGLSPLVFKIQELTHTIKGQQSKQARIERLEPDLRASKIWLPYDNAHQETHPGQWTSRQMEAMQNGQNLLCSKPLIVKHKDAPNGYYNLGDMLVEQFDEFPFGGRVDLLDVVSRIYDCDIRAPETLRDRFGGSIILKDKTKGKKTLNGQMFPSLQDFARTGRVRQSSRYTRR